MQQQQFSNLWHSITAVAQANLKNTKLTCVAWCNHGDISQATWHTRKKGQFTAMAVAQANKNEKTNNNNQPVWPGIPQAMQKHLIAQGKALCASSMVTVHALQANKEKLKQWLKQTKKKLEQQSTCVVQMHSICIIA